MVDLLFFTAPSWCGPCKAVHRAGVMEALEANGWTTTTIDVDKQRALADQFAVSAMPTFIIRVDGVPVRRITGARDAVTLERELQLAKASA